MKVGFNFKWSFGLLMEKESYFCASESPATNTISKIKRLKEL